MNSDLTTALAARDTARERLASATAALQSAREADAAAQAETQRLGGLEQAWVDRHTRRLSEWIAGGSRGASPTLVADAKQQQAQATAQAAARAAAATLAEFEAAEQTARQVLVASGQRVQQARDDLRRAEVDRIAGRLAELRDEEHRLCARLAAADLDSRGCLTVRGREALASPRGRPTAQSLLGGKLLADIHSSPAGNRAAIETARAYWRDFDANPPQPSPPPAAERAA
ncbi:MAG: hypothetical protein WAU56_07425 [Steroidobacteraceae bacterium]